MSFQIRDGKLVFGVATSLMMAGLVSAAGAQAPGPVSGSGGTFTVNADVDTYFYAGYGGEVEPPAGNNQGGVTDSVNDETYATLLLPNLNGGTFTDADFNVYADNSNNGTGPFNFRQPDFNANLLVGTGAAVDQETDGTKDDGQAYNIGTAGTTNTYTNSVENDITYTQIEHNFFEPTGDGSNNYGANGYVSISSSDPTGGSAATSVAALTTFLNNAEKSYATSPSTPVYVTFTFDSDSSSTGDTGPGAGKLSAYAVDGLSDSSSTGTPEPEFLSYGVTPAVAPTPEPAAWTTFGLGIAAVAGRLLAKKRSARQS